MGKLTDQQIAFIRLIERSDDLGDGWRSVSKAVWPLVQKTVLPGELLEIDTENRRVRLSDKGEVVSKYV